jgi:uncharacterized damage-inducible protein DinB
MPTLLHHLRRQFDYNYWMHARVWPCVLDLTVEQFTRLNDYSSGSVHRQVVHTMNIEQLWLQRAQGVNPAKLERAEKYPGRDLIRTKWDTIEFDWRGYLKTLTEESLSQKVDYQYISGETTIPKTMLRYEMLVQCLNHSTDHRAQTLAAIHLVGGRTLEQDYTLYTWDHPDSTS